mmetsp:Transcript_9210/g.19331  ORF Transcript_9210/g.19331 Transcript_9210/m.19331 type:complete len:96 (-) Transcript_9210:109-396(-)
MVLPDVVGRLLFRSAAALCRDEGREAGAATATRNTDSDLLLSNDQQDRDYLDPHLVTQECNSTLSPASTGWTVALVQLVSSSYVTEGGGDCNYDD